MARTGRPQTEISRDSFEKLCSMMCTEEEIAQFFDCSISTLKRFCRREYGANFEQTYKKFSVRGKISLRRYQFKIAETNAAMAIFLGKNYLGQTDYKPEERQEAIEILSRILAENKKNAKQLHANTETV